MAYQITDSAGVALDAHVDIEGGDIKVYARGGGKGADDARNLDYGPGLRAVLEQLAKAGVSITQAFVDSGRVQHLPIADRLILAGTEAALSPDQQFTLMSRRMKEVGRQSSKPGGNSTKLIRICCDAPSAKLKQALNLQYVPLNLASANRIPDEVFQAVQAEHIWTAAQSLRQADSWEPYAASLDYDALLEDGHRIPPKALFGKAATLALSYPVLPRHFAGGLGTVAFKTITAAGFPIVAKGDPDPNAAIPPSEEETWIEGGKRLSKHMRRERAYGLAAAKKSQFRAEHDGRLFCEECGLCPEEDLSDPLAAACIEVHHSATAVADMPDDGHPTTLGDLQCLCANCHRLVHAHLRAAETQSAA